MSTSITKNRLLHLSDLPNIQKYSPMDINKLLPIHYSTLRDNVLTMIHYESINFGSKILLHDPNLTINSTNYSQIKGGWCEDYDEKNEVSSTACIKKSIEIGVLILNYLQAMCQASIKHNHREQQQHDTCQIISKGECFTGNKVIDHEELLQSRLSFLSTSNLRLPPKQPKDQQVQTSTEYHPIDFDKEHQCFDDQASLVISYNIYKKNKKYIFITGVNQCFTMNFFNAICLYRQWNLERLKINHKLAMSFDKLSLLNVYFQHLFSIARGFVFSSLQSKSHRLSFTPMTDPNDNKKHLKMLLEQFAIEKDLQNQTELIFQQIKHKQTQIFTILDDTIKLYRFCFTYKMDSDSNEAKNSFMLKLTLQFSKVLAKVLTQIPINVHASYCFKSMHNEVTNQVVFQMIFNYKSTSGKKIFLTAEEVKLSLRNLVGYLNKENYEVVQKAQRNVADQVFKSSYLIFNKYNQILENTQSSESGHKELKEKLSQVRFAASGHNSQSLASLGLPPSTLKKNILANQTGAKQAALSQNSTIFSKSPGYSQIQVGYKKLLKSLQDRFEVDCILNPIKLKSALKQYLQPFQDINTSQALNKDQKQSLQFLGISNQMLQAEDIYHLLLKFEDNADAICEYFMQEYNYEKMVEVGKLFSGKLQQIFKQYLSLGNGFRNFRYNMVVCFMKKMLQKYYLKSSQNSIKANDSIVGSPLKQSRYMSPQKAKISQKSLYPELDLTQLNMQQLIYLLQRRTYNCTEYKNLVQAFMPQIFESRQQCRYISVILYHFYIHLLNNDHHQDLVSSFIGDLFYEIVFFTNELTSITLNNSRYRRNVVDLKEKKFYEVVREGGFINFGFSVRSLLIPELIRAEPIVEYEHLIVSTVRIQRPNYFKTVVKMIQGSFFSKNFTFLTQLIQTKEIYYQSIDRPLCTPFYPKQLQSQIQQLTNPPQKQPSKQKVNDALSNISRSESGIFRDLISINPDLKIAGLNLKEEYAKKMKEREEEEQKFTVKHFLDKVAKIDVEQAWEYVQLVLQFKDKVIEVENAKTGLHVNTSLEKNLIYIKETFQHIYTKLSKIYNYIGLSDVVYELSKINANKTTAFVA